MHAHTLLVSKMDKVCIKYVSLEQIAFWLTDRAKGK